MTKTMTSLLSGAALALAVSTIAKAQEGSIRFVWDNLQPEIRQAWQETVFDPFKEEYPNIEIDFQPTPEVTNAVRVQLTSASTAPDMFMVDATEVATYVEAGVLLPLDEYVEEYDMRSKVFPWALELGHIDGHYYSIPYEYEATMIVYNQDLLEELGLEVPRTRAEFVEACEAAMAAELDCIAQGTAGNILVQQFSYEKYLTNYGGVNAVKDLFQGKTEFTDPPVRESLELLVEDWDKGYWTSKQSPAISIQQARSLWADGKALFLAEGTFTQRFLAGANVEFDWGATSWPSMKDGVPSASAIAIGSVVSVSKHTESADAAGALLGFIYSRKDLMAQGVAMGMQPLATPFDISDLPDGATDITREMLAALLEVTSDPDNVSYAPWSFYPTKTNQYMMENMDFVFYDQMTLDEFLNGAQKVLDAELADGFVFGAP